jgi:cobalt-zinc-cadmium efflux system membrane fusion protein
MATVPASTPTVGAAPQRPSWPAAIGRFLPNIIVFGLLAAVFYVGHHTGWKLPKFSELWGAAEIAADDWCDEHLVAESQCLECKADLKPKLPSFGWCQEHGVAECVLHHPELAQTKDPPQLPAYDTVAAIALRPRPTNNSVNTLHTKVVQFASHESAEKAGIEVDVVSTAPMREEIIANGEVTFDPTHVAHLPSRVPGTAWRVLRQAGERVAAGEVLALIDAAAVGQAKTQLLQAIVDLQTSWARYERLRGLKDIPAAKTVAEAEAQLREAEIKLIATEQSLVNLGFRLPPDLAKRDPQALADELRFLGIPSDLISSIQGQTQTANLFPLVAPFAGVIVSADVVNGEPVNTEKAAYVVGDPSRMWLNLNVRQEDAPYVTTGQPVRFFTEDGRAVTEGRINWISSTIDHKSRTLPVRVFLDNSDGRLRDNTFGVGRIVLREEAQAIIVPKEAVQSAGDVQLIFVRDKNYFADGAPKFFHVRQARIGARDDKFVELLAGALPGEVVATEGSNVLLAQLLRSTLGAGCGDHGHHH